MGRLMSVNLLLVQLRWELMVETHLELVAINLPSFV